MWTWNDNLRENNYKKTINKDGEEIKQNIKRRIDGLKHKINEFLAEIKTCKESREEAKASYAQVTSKKIHGEQWEYKENYQDEKIEYREIKAKSRNLIIHRMVEDVKET